MLYEIVNPSDDYTLEADDPKIAGLAVFYLGRGQLALNDENGEPVLPLMLFGLGIDEWFKENFDIDIKEGEEGAAIAKVIEENLEAMADILDTVIIGRMSERKAFRAVIEGLPEDQREAARERFHDEKRSSLNDIGRHAWEVAKAFRKRAAELAGA